MDLDDTSDIPSDASIVLDTAVVIHLLLDNSLGRYVESSFKLRRRTLRPIISVTTVGEVQRIATMLNHGPDERQRLDDLLRELVHVPVDATVTGYFGTLGGMLDREGESMASGKLWMAATAAAVRGLRPSTLISCDAAFSRFDPDYFNVVVVDPQEHLDREPYQALPSLTKPY